MERDKERKIGRHRNEERKKEMSARNRKEE
jgi:hypothetical protein